MLASKETLRLFAVCYIFFLSVIVPAGVVAVSLYTCRKASVLVINIFNLVFAVVATMFVLLCIINDMLGIYWGAFQTSPPQPPQPLNLRDCVVMLILLIWVAGAVGLFFRKRLAWAGSIIGVGATVFIFVKGLIGTLVASFHPDAANRNYDGSGAPGYILAFVFALTVFSLCLAISLRLLFGLFQVRREFFASS